MATVYNNELEEIQLRRVILEKAKIGFTKTIPSHLIANSKINTQMDFAADGLLVALRSFIASRSENKNYVEKVEKVPLTWVDHFKVEFKHIPEWVLRKWPIKYRTIEVKHVSTVTKLCPHIELPNDDRTHFEYLMGDF